MNTKRDFIPVRAGIITDANSKIWMGHLSRCLSIANEFKEKNTTVYFICTHSGLVFETAYNRAFNIPQKIGEEN